MAQTKTTIESPRIEPDQPVDEDRELLRQWGFLDDTEDVPEEPEAASPPAGATPFDQFDPNSDTNRRLKESLSGLSGALSEFTDRPDVQSAASVIPAFGGAPSTGLILKGSGAAGILDDIRNAATYKDATHISDDVLKSEGLDLWKAVEDYIKTGSPDDILASTAEDLTLMRGLTSTLLKRFITDETREDVLPRLLGGGLDDALRGRLDTLNPLHRAVSPVQMTPRFEGLSWSLDPAYIQSRLADWKPQVWPGGPFPGAPQVKPLVGELLSDRVKPREILASFLTQPGLPWYPSEREFIRLPPKILAGLRDFNETLGRVRTPRFTDFVGDSDAAMPKAVDAPLSIDALKAWFKEKTFLPEPEVDSVLAAPSMMDFYRSYIKGSGWTP